METLKIRSQHIATESSPFFLCQHFTSCICYVFQFIQLKAINKSQNVLSLLPSVLLNRTHVW